MAKRIELFKNKHHKRFLSILYTGYQLTPNMLQAVQKMKNALSLSVNVFSSEVLIKDTIFTSSIGDRTVILHGHLSHVKVKPLVVEREYLHFSVILS